MTLSADHQTALLLEQARAGDRQALGNLLDRHRAYLKLLARRHLDGCLNQRLDESDLVQQTCLSAFQNFEKFRGTSAGEFAAWLRQVHVGNMQNAVREHVAAQKRAMGRERPLAAAEELPNGDPSPSKRALESEAAVALAAAIERLPDDQGEAVRLRFVEGLSLEMVACKMGRSRDAAVGLIRRGLLNLRKHLQ